MSNRLHLLVASVLLATGSLSAFLVWRNSPTQVAVRYLDKLARTASVSTENTTLNRRMRASPLAAMLASPLVIVLPEIRVSGSFEEEELQSGYLAVTSEASYFQVLFSRVKLLENQSSFLRLAARLQVHSDYSEDPFPIDQMVEVRIEKDGKRLLLSRVSAGSAGS